MLTKKNPNSNTSSTAVAQEPKTQQATQTSSSTTAKTRIIVHYDTGFGNNLTIRGEGGGLSWGKGQALKNINANTWLYESDRPGTITFKALINDQHYERGENHIVQPGTSKEFTPHF